FSRPVAYCAQEKLRGNVVVRGKKEDAVSELEAGRRTIVRDPDDPVQQADILDNLMISREEDLEEELRAAYMPDDGGVEGGRPGKKGKFDGGYATTMQGAEAFFNKPSPFQKAAEKEREATEAASERDDQVANAIDGAETAVETTGEVVKDPLTDEASQRITGSVGGRWEKPEEGVELDKHKPGVGSWGVFERPKDMSKAYGGGRDPTLKRMDPEETRRRDEETKAILRSYRGSVGEDLQREKKNEVEIQAALDQSKRAMRFGDTFGAVSALEAVKQECSTHGPLGAVVFLELAMALEATGRSYQAQDIYKVLRRSKNREVRAQAKRLNEGLEAMDMLKFGRPGEVEEESEISKMWAKSFNPVSGDTEKKYSSVFFEKDADGRPKGDNVFAVDDAKQVLLFASKYPGGISSKRIINAFEFLRKRSEEAALAARREASALRKQAQAASAENPEQQQAEEPPAAGEGEGAESSAEGSLGLERRPAPWVRNAESTLPKGGAGLVSLMGDMSSLEQRIQGGWNLVIKAGGSKVEVFERDSSLILSPGGSVKAVEPAGPLSVSKEGQWELDPDDRVVKLDYASSKWVGLVDVGGGQEGLGVLALDDQLMVAFESARAGAGARVGSGTARTGVVKYRLLVRQ
ncbi:unnamed protein product, partial [Laminaria digitata]